MPADESEKQPGMIIVRQATMIIGEHRAVEWEIVGGVLTLRDRRGALVASYAPGHWSSVETNC